MFSQFGDDGIIQFLISHLPIPNRTFIEFGVENYLESNTRFLLINNRWKGLVLDGDQKNVDQIRHEKLFWYHDLQARQAFITRENINQLIGESGFAPEVGILSIDIDGMDYWVWDAIDSIRPAIVISEYNSAFGPDRCVTLPYNPNFVWNRTGDRLYYWGTSLGALHVLADKKGYDLFGCNSAGNNAYFIRRDLRGDVPASNPQKAFVDAQFALGRDQAGRLVRGTEGMGYLRGSRVYDVLKGCEVTFES